MTRKPIATALTSDFRQAFEAETTFLLRTRFLWFTGVMGAFNAAMALITLIVQLVAKPYLFGDSASSPVSVKLDPGPGSGWHWAVEVAELFGFWGCFFAVRFNKVPRDQLLNLTMLLVVYSGVLNIVGDALGISGVWGMPGVMVTHLVACLFLPWSPEQALKPFLPLLALFAATQALEKHVGGLADRAGKVVFMTALGSLAGLPGILVCWARHSRRMEAFKVRFLSHRYGEVRRELTDARRIHESLFPVPKNHGPLTLRYLYEPMRDIGGDYLYLFATREEVPGHVPDRMNVVVLDVTGHGIAAALTVNRLHGELQRIFAEHPHITPGETLRLLNRYVNLTLADHCVFATAICARVDADAGLIEFASGGHPPAFVRAVDGTLHQLRATAVVLGALPDAEFDPAPATTPFGPGDSLIVYTDGALESRGASGRMLGLAGLERILASNAPDPSGGWPATLLHAVEQFRAGPPHDDTLVVEVTRSTSLAATRRAVLESAGARA